MGKPWKKQKNFRFCSVLLIKTVSNTAKTRFQIAVCKGQGVPSMHTKNKQCLSKTLEVMSYFV